MQLPIKETILSNSIGFYDNKIYYLEWPVEGSRNDGWYDLNSDSKGVIKYYDLATLEEQTYMSGISSFNIDSRSGSIITASNKEEAVCFGKRTPVGEESPLAAQRTVSSKPPRPKAITGAPAAIASTGAIPKSSIPA